MTSIEIIKSTLEKNLSGEQGGKIEIQFLAGLDEETIALFESSLPCILANDIRELLRFCRGFEGTGVEQVDFTGEELMFEHREIFPHGVPIASDGLGNFWVVDLAPDSSTFGPIWFACHDAPVVLYQSPDLNHFLIELFKMCEPPHRSLIDEVHEDRISNVWQTNPYVLEQQKCVDAKDQLLYEFANSLDPSYQIIDLRSMKIGDGFSWGRYGPKTVIKRHGTNFLFAYQRKKGLLSKLFR